jgi:hypothetical protein
MLIASCKEYKIETKLIKGQTSYLKDMFLNDFDEIYELLFNLNNEVLERKNLQLFKKDIRDKGKHCFRLELKGLYTSLFIEKKGSNFINTDVLNRFKYCYDSIVALYEHYLDSRNCYELSFIKRYISSILENNPQFIGFSFYTHPNVASQRIMRLVKKATGLPIIAGGCFTPTVSSEELSHLFFKEYIDYLVVGAGEYALPNLIETLRNGKEPFNVPNVYYRKKASIKTNRLETIADLNKLPFPDFSQFDLDLYLNHKRVLPLQDARGCSWNKCLFCDYKYNHLNNYSTIGIERVVDIIRYLRDTYNCQYFVFHNDDLPPKRAKDISLEIINRKLKGIFIQTYARLDKGFNSDILSTMRKAGFCSIVWGLESGSQKVLNLMNKGININIASRVLKMAKKNKIANFCSVIYDFPGETCQDIKRTISFLKEHAKYISAACSQLFVLSPWAPIYKTYSKRKKGRVNRAMNYSQLQNILNRFELELRMGLAKIKFVDCQLLLLWTLFDSSYEAFDNKDILRSLKKNYLPNFFPLIPGKVMKKDKLIKFFPLNISETRFFNKYLPSEEINIDKFEERIIYFSSGGISTLEIFNKLINIFSEEYSKKQIRDMYIIFLRKLYTKNFALGYNKQI